MVVYPIVYSVLYIPGGVGFQPSTVGHISKKGSCSSDMLVCRRIFKQICKVDLLAFSEIVSCTTFFLPLINCPLGPNWKHHPLEGKGNKQHRKKTTLGTWLKSKLEKSESFNLWINPIQLCETMPRSWLVNLPPLTNTHPRNMALWSRLTNHWFPLIRPAIKPLFLGGGLVDKPWTRKSCRVAKIMSLLGRELYMDKVEPSCASHLNQVVTYWYMSPTWLIKKQLTTTCKYPQDPYMVEFAYIYHKTKRNT